MDDQTLTTFKTCAAEIMRVKPALIGFFGLVLCSLHVAGLAASQTWAQAMVLRETDAAPFLTTSGPSRTRIVVNGPIVLGAEKIEDTDKPMPLGRFGRLLLALTALRQAEAGRLDLDQPIASLLPDLVAERAFEPALTARHLMAEVAGFAAPPWYRTDGKPPLMDPARAKAPLSRYILHLRYAGRMYHDDIVAAALLSELIARIHKGSVLNAIKQEVLELLNLPENAVSIDEPGPFPDAFQTVLSLKGSFDLITAVVRQLFDQPKNALLGDNAQDLLNRRPFWIFHPMGLARTLGLEYRIVAGQRYLSLGRTPCEPGIALAVLPAQDLAFIDIHQPDPSKPCSVQSSFHGTAAQIAFNHIPPGILGEEALERAESLRRSDRIAGFYIRETLPRADLRSRLNAIYEDTRFLKPEDSGDRILFRRGRDSRTFESISPLAYVESNESGADQSSAPGQLIFSPIGRQGYLRTDGTDIYRFIGLLGDQRLVLSPFPWMMLLMLSGGLHLLNRKSAVWCQLGRNALFGTILFGTGLALELNYWAEAIYALNMPWLVLVWRIVLNLGLALILAVTLSGLQIARRKTDMPMGPLMLPVSVHLTFLTGGSLILFMVTIAWGLAGEFWPL